MAGGLVNAVFVFGQLALFTSLPAIAAAVLGVLAGGCVTAGYALDVRHGAGQQRPGEELQISLVGLFLALLVAAAVMVGMLVWSSAPWWAAVLAGTVTGPLLVAAAAGVRSLVEHLVRRASLEADLACSAGLLSGALAFTLVGAGAHRPVAGAVAAGAGIWIVCSLAAGLVLSSPGLADHSQ